MVSLTCTIFLPALSCVFLLSVCLFCNTLVVVHSDIVLQFAPYVQAIVLYVAPQPGGLIFCLNINKYLKKNKRSLLDLSALHFIRKKGVQLFLSLLCNSVCAFCLLDTACCNIVCWLFFLNSCFWLLGMRHSHACLGHCSCFISSLLLKFV